MKIVADYLIALDEENGKEIFLLQTFERRKYFHINHSIQSMSSTSYSRFSVSKAAIECYLISIAAFK